jgi:hypothetical protein
VGQIKGPQPPLKLRDWLGMGAFLALAVFFSFGMSAVICLFAEGAGVEVNWGPLAPFVKTTK